MMENPGKGEPVADPSRIENELSESENEEEQEIADLEDTDGQPLLTRLKPYWKEPLTENGKARHAFEVGNIDAVFLRKEFGCNTIAGLVKVFKKHKYENRTNEFFERAQKGMFHHRSAQRLASMLTVLSGEDDWREEELKKLRRIISKYRFSLEHALRKVDTTGNGMVSRVEFRKAIEAQGIPISLGILDELYSGLSVESEENTMSVMDFFNYAAVSPEERALALSKGEREFISQFIKEPDWKQKCSEVDKERFGALIRDFFINIDGYVKNEMYRVFDLNQIQSLDQSELILGVCLLLGATPRDRANLLFNIMDKGNVGSVSKNELLTILGTMSNSWIQDPNNFKRQRDELYALVDMDSDSQITREELLDLLDRSEVLSSIVQQRPHQQEKLVGGERYFIEMNIDDPLDVIHLDKMSKAAVQFNWKVWMHETIASVKVRVEYGNKIKIPEPGTGVFKVEYWAPSREALAGARPYADDMPTPPSDGREHVIGKMFESVQQPLTPEAFRSLVEMVPVHFPTTKKAIKVTDTASVYDILTKDQNGSRTPMTYEMFRAGLCLLHRSLPEETASWCFSLAKVAPVHSKHAVVYVQDMKDILSHVYDAVVRWNIVDPEGVLADNVGPSMRFKDMTANIKTSVLSFDLWSKTLESHDSLWELFMYGL